MSKLPSLRDIETILSGFSRALHPRELASRLDLAPEDYSQLIALLDELEQDDALKVLPGGRVRVVERRGKAPRPGASPPQNKGDETWQGDLSVHAKGFGFVTAPGHDDVFIPPDAVYEAMHGDTIKVRVTGRSRKGLEGCVVEVIKRRSVRIAGVIQKRRKSTWLEPDDSRLRGPVVITGDSSNANDGDAAIVDIVRFPQFPDELAEAELVEILGPQGDPQTEVRKILLRESIREDHPPEALQNAEKMAHRLRRYRLDSRRDLRDIPLPTIDPDDARDHDDALWVERISTGYRAYVAIADVSEYVRPESALDEEARHRGCTIYLPDRAIPMLPRALAGDLCSLLPDRDRFCMCVIVDLDQNARVKTFEIVEGLMRSQAKLTYGNVARTLGFDDESPQSAQADAMYENLKALQELTEMLRKNRMSRGALDLDLPEARVVVDEESGAPTEVKKRATRPGLKRAYSLVEEMMLMANELVAEWLSKKKAPAIYRIHGQPDEAKLERLATVTKDLKVKVDVESLGEPLGASKFLRSIRTHDRKAVLEMLMLRSLKQAVYDINNIGHFGLASQRYAHFTSPIRRYPDLRVHRQIKSILRGNAIDRSDEAQDDLAAAAAESSKKERAAMEVEREVLNLYKAIYMQGHIGDEFEGRVTGMSSAGLYIAIDEPCVDVMIAFDELGPDRYTTDELEIGVVGERSGEHIMMGDKLRLEILDVGIMRRTVYGRRLNASPLRVEEESYDDGFSPRSKTFRGRSSAGRSIKDRRTPRPISKKDSPGARDDERTTRTTRASSTRLKRAGKPGARKIATSDATQRIGVRSTAGESSRKGAERKPRITRKTIRRPK